MSSDASSGYLTNSHFFLQLERMSPGVRAWVRINQKARISPNPGRSVLSKVGWRPRHIPWSCCELQRGQVGGDTGMKMKPALSWVEQDQGVPKPSCGGCKDRESMSTTHTGKQSVHDGTAVICVLEDSWIRCHIDKCWSENCNLIPCNIFLPQTYF